MTFQIIQHFISNLLLFLHSINPGSNYLSSTWIILVTFFHEQTECYNTPRFVWCDSTYTYQHRMISSVLFFPILCMTFYSVIFHHITKIINNGDKSIRFSIYVRLCLWFDILVIIFKTLSDFTFKRSEIFCWASIIFVWLISRYNIQFYLRVFLSKTCYIHIFCESNCLQHCWTFLLRHH